MNDLRARRKGLSLIAFGGRSSAEPMMLAATYWLFIVLVAIGKAVAFVVWVVLAIALPLTRIQVAAQRPGGFDRAMLVNLAVLASGLVGVYLLLDNARIFVSTL